MAASIKVWIDNSAPECAAADLNGFNLENNNLIESAGMSLDGSDHTQTSKAVAMYSVAADYFTETGSGNTYELDPTTSGGGTLYAPIAYRDGMKVRFISTHTNTGPATLNVNEIGPKNIITFAGTALIGGELVVDQYYELVYSATLDAFRLQTMNDYIVGEMKPYPGTVAPAGWLFTYLGTASRTTYPALFATVTFTLTATTTSGSPVVTGLSSTANLFPGMQLTSSAFTGVIDIVSVDSGSQITVSANPSTPGAATIRFYPFGAGDGVNTFGLPGRSGRGLIASGAGAGLTPRINGQIFGAENVAPTLAQLTPHTHPQASGTMVEAPPGSPCGNASNFYYFNGGNTQSAGGGSSFNIQGPSEVINWIIKY